jgi:hypothetical protein
MKRIDKIRQMSSEELAELLQKIHSHGWLMCSIDNFDNMPYTQEWLEEELGSNYCQDKANGLISCDGCYDKDCPLIKREMCNE